MSPIKQAVGRFLEIVGLGHKVRVFSYQDDFELLWGLAVPDGVAYINATQTVLVVWDGQPESAAGSVVSVTEYTTPVDWAVAYSIHHGKSGPSRIVLLDCSPPSNDAKPAVKFYDSFASSMPWIRVVSAKASLCQLLRELSTKGEDEDRSSALHLLSRYWTVNLLKTEKPGDHHALANIMGPLMLLGGDEGGAQERALQQMMKWIGLCPVQDGQSDTARLGLFDGRKTPLKSEMRAWSKKRGRPLHALLVDDCAFEHRWDQVLCQALGVPRTNVQGDNSEHRVFESKEDSTIRLAAMASPKVFFRSLLNQLGLDEDMCSLASGGAASANPRRDLRFGLRLSGNGALEPLDILFLDLRLFIDEKLEEEALFYERVLQLIDLVQGAPEEQDAALSLPWQRLSANDLELAAKWVDANKPGGQPGGLARETPEHFQALTLLPRLVALLDLSLPIVLFSSTGRRDIVEILKPYGNIITGFEKPRLESGLHGDPVANANAQLGEALTTALELLDARVKCQDIQELETSEVSKWKGITRGGACYVELYLDEAGGEDNKPLTVGGCFGAWFAPDLKAAKAFADEFDDRAVDNGIRYFDGLGVGPQPTGPILRKNQLCRNELDVTRQDWQNRAPDSFQLGTVFVKSHPNANIGNDLLDSSEIDNRNRLAVNRLIELFLAESLPALLHANEIQASEVEVSIYGATRLVRIDDVVEQDLIKARWGLNALDGHPELLFSFGRSEVYPIAANVLETHGLARSIWVRRALAIRLVYKHPTGNQTPADAQFFLCRQCGIIYSAPQNTCDECGAPLYPDYRALQYLADEILSYYPRHKLSCQLNPYASFFSTPVPGEFDDVNGKALGNVIQASRYLDQRNPAHAIFALPPTKPPEPRQDEPHVLPSAGFWTALRIARESLPSLSGEEFLELAHSMAGECSKKGAAAYV